MLIVRDRLSTGWYTQRYHKLIVILFPQWKPKDILLPIPHSILLFDNAGWCEKLCQPVRSYNGNFVWNNILLFGSSLFIFWRTRNLYWEIINFILRYSYYVFRHMFCEMDFINMSSYLRRMNWKCCFSIGIYSFNCFQQRVYDDMR